MNKENSARMAIGSKGIFSRPVPLIALGNAAYLSPEKSGFYRLEVDFTASSPLPSEADIAIGDPGSDQKTQTVKLYPVGRRAHFALRLDQGGQRITIAFDKTGVESAGPPKAQRRNERIWSVQQFLKYMQRTARRPGGLVRLSRHVLGLYREGGVRAIIGSIRELTEHEQRPPTAKVSYARWIAAHDYSHERDANALRARVGRLNAHPSFAVVVPVTDNQQIEATRNSIESVYLQVYNNWCLYTHGVKPVDDLSHLKPSSPSAEMTTARVEFDCSLKSVQAAVNSAAVKSAADWLVVLAPGTILREDALAEFAVAAEEQPAAKFIYTDEDRRTADGLRVDPHFKPEFSRELLHSSFYIGSAFAVRRDLFLEVGGLAEVPAEATLFDLVLKIAEAVGHAGIAHIAKVLFHLPEASVQGQLPWEFRVSPAGAKVLSSHLDRTEFAAEVDLSDIADAYRVRPSLPDPPPLVSLIIATRDNAALLERCIQSIKQKTRYPNYEIVVIDNNTTQKKAIDYLNAIDDGDHVRVFPFPHPFNYSKLANLGVKYARGAVVGLLNNDMEVISPDWLAEMTAWALCRDVGCVGAKLYYADDTIQHAGVILGPDGVGGHAFRWRHRNDPGYFERANIHQNLSAVTGACLFVEKHIYLRVGGFDEQRLKVAYNDVDFCLKAGKLGLMQVWTPYAELYHFESKSRGIDNSASRRSRHAREYNYMRATWADEIENDPYYSVNLSRQNANYELRE